MMNDHQFHVIARFNLLVLFSPSLPLSLGDFLDLRGKIFFLMKYPVGCHPPRIKFFFLNTNLLVRTAKRLPQERLPS